jgi:hypothetical protein
MAADGFLIVAGPLGSLFPGGGIRRGSVLAVSGVTGSMSLLLALLAGAMTDGSWAAVTGMPGVGMEAAEQAGVPLGRLIMVPQPGRCWMQVAAVLVDAVDVAVVCPPARCPPGDTRRLAARARQRGGVLVVYQPAGGLVGCRGAPWPDAADFHLEVTGPPSWRGLGQGHGVLGCRLVGVRLAGRRIGREQAAQLWLPGADGRAGPACEVTHRDRAGSLPDVAAGALAG